MYCYSEGVEAHKTSLSPSPRPGVCVSTVIHVVREKHKRLRKRTGDRALGFACSVVMHIYMQWFYELSVKSSGGWHGRGILSVEAILSTRCNSSDHTNHETSPHRKHQPLCLHRSPPLSVYSSYLCLVFACCLSLHWLLKRSTTLIVFPPFLLSMILWFKISNTFSDLNLPLIVTPHVCHPVVAVHWGFILLMLRFTLVLALIHLSATCSPQPAAALTAVHSWSVYALLSKSGWLFLYWILRVCVHVAVHVSLCPLHASDGIRAPPCLRRSTLNTGLVKLPCGVVWPFRPHRSLSICHNNNEHEMLSRSVIVPLHYLQSISLELWLSYAQRCHTVFVSSLRKLFFSLWDHLVSALPRLKSCRSTDVTPCL